VKIALAICAVLSMALIVLLAVAWGSVDVASSSTGSLVYLWLPIYGILGLILIWGAIFPIIRSAERRFVNRKL